MLGGNAVRYVEVYMGTLKFSAELSTLPHHYTNISFRLSSTQYTLSHSEPRTLCYFPSEHYRTGAGEPARRLVSSHAPQVAVIIATCSKYHCWDPASPATYSGAKCKLRSPTDRPDKLCIYKLPSTCDTRWLTLEPYRSGFSWQLHLKRRRTCSWGL